MVDIGQHGSGCFPQPAGLEANLIWRPAAKRMLRPNTVYKTKYRFNQNLESASVS